VKQIKTKLKASKKEQKLYGKVLKLYKKHEKLTKKYTAAKEEIALLKSLAEEHGRAVDIELGDAANKYQQLEGACETANATIKQLRETMASLKALAKEHDDAAEEELQEALEENKVLEAEWEKAKSTIQGLKEALAKLKALVKEHDDAAEEELEEALAENKVLEADLAAANASIEALKAELAQANANLADCEASKLAMAAPAPAPANKKEAMLERIKENAKSLDFDRIGTASADNKDDLKTIKGIGPFIETKLNALGIYTFQQIANFTLDDEEKVNKAIEFFAGRVRRDDWVGQAKKLIEG